MIDFTKILSLFEFDKRDPLLFASSFFLFLFAFVLIIYLALSKKKTARVTFLLLFSCFFYYKSSNLYFALLIFTSIANFFIGKWIFILQDDFKRRMMLIFGILINLALLGYFKYTNFFIQIMNDFNFAQIEALEIFLPIGISFYIFKALSYIIDNYIGIIEPENNFLDFALYISFFPSLLAGPIDRAEKFLPQVKQNVFISADDIGRGLLLIISGLFKKIVIADYISLNFVDRVLDAPLRFTGVENLLATYGYTLQIYCDFSGYSDMAIGISLMMGYKLMDNFNSPYKSASVAEFWRRWHISLSTWLLDYVFKPLQMNFRNMRLAGNALAILITFVLCGFWHGAAWTFLIWGLIHGLLMSFSLITKTPRAYVYKKLGLSGTKFQRIFQVFITFHLIAFSWIFFRVDTFQTAMDVFNQIINFFQPEVFLQFISAYPFVVIFIVIGYALHFTPKSWEIKTEGLLTKTPLLGKALILVAVIWFAAQVRSADMVPFIYFQF